MKPGKHNPLLRELLAGEELTEFRRASLERGLASLRRRRRLQRIGRSCILAAVPLLVASAILFNRSRETAVRQAASSNPSPVSAVPSTANLAEVKFITDEQLFALFPGRALALIGKPGRQELIFLDGPPDAHRGL